MRRFTTLAWALPALVAGQKPQYPPAFPATPFPPSSINYAPSVTPNVMDTTAPNAQVVCPGYKASSVEEITTDLILSVQYQSKEKLAVKIYPKHLAPSNQSLYILSPSLTPQPGGQYGSSKSASDLQFTWTNSPSFQFRITRASSGDVIFDTYGHKLVFEDQFLELVTDMVPEYNIYGLPENLRGFRIPNNFTQTFWNAYKLDNDQELDVNSHSVHPVYLETRYGNGSSMSHGVYARNAHGQEWLMRDRSITYRTIDGSFDLYFLSGSKPADVISQYQTGIVNTPYLQLIGILASSRSGGAIRIGQICKT
ncbi:hypothetical protein LTS10_008266 [Elasticomyces elasticus]|nr:hypothetical protein LTS10_008266 [Elasticomyces elasticus]